MSSAFEQVAGPSTDLTSVAGAYPLDVDGDGLVDLAVLRVGENVMLRGLGNCRFERANEAWGIDGGNEWTAAFSAQWEGAAVVADSGVWQLCRLDREWRASRRLLRQHDDEASR